MDYIPTAPLREVGSSINNKKKEKKKDERT